MRSGRIASSRSRTGGSKPMRDPGEMPERIRELLGGAARRFGIEDAAAVSKIWARWDRVVGEDIATHAQPASLKGGTLRVQAESPVWATEIGYLADEIRARVNAAVGAPTVRRVVVFTAPGGPSVEDRRKRRTTRSGRVDAGGSGTVGQAARDPFDAFEKARKAWAARHR